MVVTEDKTESSYVEAGDALPPAYTQADSVTSAISQDVPPTPPPPPAAASSSSSSAPAAPSPVSPPTNYLNISRTNHSIKGTYTIDPTMKMPPISEPPLDADGRKLNMRLASENGSIDTVVYLVRGSDAKGPALLEADSKNGSVTVKVQKSPQHFRLRAASNNGAVTVRLPSNFTGPVSTRINYGRLTFSPAVQARLTTFSEEGSEGRFFIGDFAVEGYENDESWMGDAVRVEADNGRVNIGWSDEQEPERKGFFGRFFA